MADQIQIVNPPSAKEINEGNEFLYKFRSVFPLEMFPDEVILDRLKISIVKRDFIFSKRVTTIPLTGTVNVKIFRGPFISQIEIVEMSTLKQEGITVRNIWNHHASTFHKLVEGIVIGMRQGVNFMEMNRDEMMETAIKWGAVDIEGV